MLTVQNCSTIFNGGSQYIIAEPSNQNGDHLPVRIETLSGAYNGKLPATIVTRPSSFSDVIIELEQPCFVEQRIKVTKSVTSSFWANILIGGLIGMTIDYYTGYMWKLDKHIIIPTEKKEDCPQSTNQKKKNQ